MELAIAALNKMIADGEKESRMDWSDELKEKLAELIDVKVKFVISLIAPQMCSTRIFRL